MQLVTDLLRCLKKNGSEKIAECVLSVRMQWEKLPENSDQWLAYKQAALEELDRISDQSINLND